MNKNLTAIVFTKNEERRIPLIHKNFENFCEIIVFDGGSTDGTQAYCEKNGIKFVRRSNDYDATSKLQWVLDNTPTDYVIHVYCAHFYPKEFLSRLGEVANENRLSAVFHDVIIYRYGDVVHRPLFRRVSSACVFYKKSIITFENSKIHDELEILFDQQSMVRLQSRDELSLHLFQDEDCESFTKKTINYAALEARQRFALGERMTGFMLLFGPVGRFVYRYFRTGAFARGVKGLVYSVLNFVYDLNVCVILWELSNGHTFDDAIKKNAYKKAKLQINNFKG